VTSNARRSMTAPALAFQTRALRRPRCTRVRQACHRRALLRRPARVTGARHHLWRHMLGLTAVAGLGGSEDVEPSEGSVPRPWRTVIW
jgi:hypothetical protein